MSEYVTPGFLGQRTLLLPAEVPESPNPTDQGRQYHPVEHQVFASLSTHRKRELGNKFLAVVVFYRHDADEFPVLGESMLEGESARRIFLWREIGDANGVEGGFVRQFNVRLKW